LEGYILFGRVAVQAKLGLSLDSKIWINIIQDINQEQLKEELEKLNVK